jgi:hypothetical protein
VSAGSTRLRQSALQGRRYACPAALCCRWNPGRRAAERSARPLCPPHSASDCPAVRETGRNGSTVLNSLDSGGGAGIVTPIRTDQCAEGGSRRSGSHVTESRWPWTVRVSRFAFSLSDPSLGPSPCPSPQPSPAGTACLTLRQRPHPTPYQTTGERPGGWSGIERRADLSADCAGGYECGTVSDTSGLPFHQLHPLPGHLAVGSEHTEVGSATTVPPEARQRPRRLLASPHSDVECAFPS